MGKKIKNSITIGGRVFNFKHKGNESVINIKLKTLDDVKFFRPFVRQSRDSNVGIELVSKEVTKLITYMGCTFYFPRNHNKVYIYYGFYKIEELDL